MKERAVNGIPIQEVWKRLGEEFPEEETERHPAAMQGYLPAEKPRSATIAHPTWVIGALSQRELCGRQRGQRTA